MAESTLVNRLRERILHEGPLSFAAFMEMALYDPEVGYYRKPRPRVGREGGTDFTTSSALPRTFLHLLGESFTRLLPESTEAYRITEIGAEDGGLPWEQLTIPYAGIDRIAVGETLAVAGPQILFANELLDAQPFHRLIFQSGTWRESRVGLSREGFLEEVYGPLPREDLAHWLAHLPPEAPEGYRLDVPTGAERLLAEIARQPWYGLLVLIDYGKTRPVLCQETPTGTLRAYRQHQQEKDLLADPGEIDLTGHICWDCLEEILRAQHCQVYPLERQESFFVRYAAPMIQNLMENPGRYGVDPRRRELQTLLHPGHFGGAFQVLAATRGKGTTSSAQS